MTGSGGNRGAAGLPHRGGYQTADRFTPCDSRPNLLAERARRQSAQLRTDVPILIAKIDIQFYNLISRLTARRVSHPGGHLSGTRRDNAQRVQRKRQSWLASLTIGFQPAVDQSNRRLQRAVHQTWMEDIVS